jgi:hypothetical protein
MRIRDDRASFELATTDTVDEILSCRMAMLGLDLHAIDNHDSGAIAAIRLCCKSCEDRDACAVDLRRDPNSPVWVNYCPNSAAFNSLTKDWW